MSKKESIKIGIAFFTGFLISLSALFIAWLVTFIKYFSSSQIGDKFINSFILIFGVSALMLFVVTLPFFWKQKGVKLNTFLTGFMLSVLVILYIITGFQF